MKLKQQISFIDREVKDNANKNHHKLQEYQKKKQQKQKVLQDIRQQNIKSKEKKELLERVNQKREEFSALEKEVQDLANQVKTIEVKENQILNQQNRKT